MHEAWTTIVRHNVLKFDSVKPEPDKIIDWNLYFFVSINTLLSKSKLDNFSLWFRNNIW